MANLSVNGLDGLILSIEEMAYIPDNVKDEILEAQAAVVVKAQKNSAKNYGVERTGVTLESIKAGKPKTTKSGRAVYVYPRGTNADGNRNAEVAFINEYGAPGRGIKARPFIRAANETSAAETERVAAAVYDKWLKTKNL